MEDIKPPHWQSKSACLCHQPPQCWNNVRMNIAVITGIKPMHEHTTQVPTNWVPAPRSPKYTCGTIPQRDRPATWWQVIYIGRGSSWIGSIPSPSTCWHFLPTGLDSITIQRVMGVTDPPTLCSTKHYLRPSDPLYDRGAVAAGMWYENYWSCHLLCYWEDCGLEEQQPGFLMTQLRGHLGDDTL